MMNNGDDTEMTNLTNLQESIYGLVMDLTQTDLSKFSYSDRKRIEKLITTLADADSMLNDYIEDEPTVAPHDEVDPIDDPNNTMSKHHY